MAIRTPLRRRHARSRRARVGAALALVSLASVVAALLATGPAAPVRTAAAPCLPPLLTCPTPTPTASQSHTATPKPPPPSTPKPSSGHPRTPAPTSPTQPAYIPPAGTPLPTLPPPSPGSPPEPPTLAVQTVNLALASAAPAHPGDEVLVQATLEAQRGTDTYAVPGATISFSITSQAGNGASVDPSQADSGDTGVVVVTVQTGDSPGDTVLHAVSGDASADITVHSDPQPTPSPMAKPTHAAGAGVIGPSSPSNARRLLVAGLASLLAAMVAAYTMALVLGRLPNPLQRRRLWGRRTR